MRKVFRLVAALAALAAASAIFIILAENKGTYEGQADPARASDEMGSLLEDVTVVASRAGEVQWELKASRIEFDSKNTIASLKNIQLNVPEASIAFRSEGGSFDADTGSLTMSGDVTGRRDGTSIAFGSDVSLAEGGRQIVSDSDVTIEAPGYRISGRGLIADEEGVRIKSDVRAEIN